MGEIHHHLGGANSKQRILHDQLRLAFVQARLAWFAELSLVLITTAVVWQDLETDWLIPWLAIALLNVITLAGTRAGYVSSKNSVDQTQFWAAWFVISALLSGLVWGGALLYTLFFLTDTQAWIGGLLVLGAALFAFITKAAVQAALVMFIVGLLTPCIVWFATQGGLLHPLLPVSSVAYIGLLWMIQRRVRMHMAMLSRLGIENTELLRNLAESKRQAEASKRETERLNAGLKNEIAIREQAEEKIKQSEREISAILHNVRDTLFRADPGGQIQWVSPSVQPLLGYPAAQIIGKSLREFYLYPAKFQDLLLVLEDNMGMARVHIAKLRRNDGRLIWGSFNVHYFHDVHGNLVGIEGTIRDITEYKNAQEELFQERSRALVTLEAIGDGVTTTDVQGNITYLNPAAEKFTGWRSAEAKGKPFLSVLRLVDEDTHALLEDNPVQRCVSLGTDVVMSEPALLIHRSEEKEFCIELRGGAISDTDGEITGTVFVFHDVTKLRNLAHQMWYQATHDPLTGLINRREFEAQLRKVISDAEHSLKRSCICYLDLDQFKIVNDTCGHIAGDELLKELSTYLTAQLREADTLARLGGDEFGVLLKGCPITKAQDIAETLRAAVQAFRFNWMNREFRVGVSIGVVPVTEQCNDLTQILSAADSAMYVAKEQGRNQVHVFQSQDTAVAQFHGEMQWKQKIDAALQDNAFQLFFQPIVALAGAQVPQLFGEVLLRMHDDDGSLIAPVSFLPSAERYHLMSVIDRWVISTLFQKLAKRNTQQLTAVHCAVNLSGQTMSDESFLDFVVDQLQIYEIDPGTICFEITETAAVANIESAIYLVNELRGIGCSFALDDFGSGMSSFAYLKNLSLDYLKIDGSFIMNVLYDSKDRSVVKAINEIGHALNIRTVAEFVENERILDILKILNVDYAQGFGVQKPCSIDEYFAKQP